MNRELPLPAALDVQIRTLRLRRAVLTAVASRGSTHEEMDMMHELARLSEDERQRLIGDFLDAVFGDLVVRRSDQEDFQRSAARAGLVLNPC